MSINHVVLLGHLTRDPELRYTPAGNAVCQFGIALNRRYRTPTGDVREEATFVEVIVWGQQAEVVSGHMTRGRAVFVEGRLHLDTWETPAGERRSRVKVVAQRVTFLPRPGAVADGPAAEYEVAADTIGEEA